MPRNNRLPWAVRCAAGRRAGGLTAKNIRTMQRRSVAAGVAALVAAAAACSVDPEPKWTALEQPIAFGTTAVFHFVPEQTGHHQVRVQFGDPITDRQIESLVESAAATTGEPGAPTFDFTWSVDREGTPVGRRDAPQQSTGVVDTHPSGFGEGPRVSRALVFGGCILEAGRAYTLRLAAGSEFDRFANAHPRIVVAYQPTEFRIAQ